MGRGRGRTSFAGRLRRPKNKYGAIKVKADGYTFDSKLEARCYEELKLRQTAGEIRIEKVHPRYPIEIRGKPVCVVELDFAYHDLKQDKCHFIDVKGMDNALSRLKRKIVCAEYNIEVEVIPSNEKKSR